MWEAVKHTHAHKFCAHNTKSKLLRAILIWLPTPRIELGTFRLQGERINHFAKQACKGLRKVTYNEQKTQPAAAYFHSSLYSSHTKKMAGPTSATSYHYTLNSPLLTLIIPNLNIRSEKCSFKYLDESCDSCPQLCSPWLLQSIIEETQLQPGNEEHTSSSTSLP